MINQVGEKTIFFNKSGVFLLEKEGISIQMVFLVKKQKQKENKEI